MTMRRAVFNGTMARGRRLFDEASFVHVAGSAPDGEPILRALDAAVLDDALVFHGSPVGEKTALVAQRVVVETSRVVAHIPSWFTDPERACPATTLYESAQVHGVLEAVASPDEKARALEALMAKHQPGGGYVPMTGTNPLYAKALSGLLVVRIALANMDVKCKLAQNRSPAERAKILVGLWTRGHDGDAEAIELVRRAAPPSAHPALAFLAGPEGTTLGVAMVEPHEPAEAAELLRGAYWLVGCSDALVAESFRKSAAVVFARSANGDLVGTARAVTDGRSAWIFDVMVHPLLRGKRLGEALVRTLLDHPALRNAPKVRLRTLDAEPFYQRLGFHSLGQGFMERHA